MAKVKTPLLSFNARGTLAGNITFQNYPGGTKVYPHRIHADAQSPAQLTQRSYFDEARTIWNLLTPAEQEAWNETAEPEYTFGYNAFLSWYINKMIVHPFGWLFDAITFNTRWFYQSG